MFGNYDKSSNSDDDIVLPNYFPKYANLLFATNSSNLFGVEDFETLYAT